MSAPPHCTASSRHDRAGVPFSRIVQEPQTPCSQPSLVPVRPPRPRAVSARVMFEEASYTPDGLPEAGTLLDYLLPTAADMPPVELLETETPNPNVPFGSKGAGEAGCIGVPPAVVSAVCDALDIDHIDMPLTPETVWRAAHQTR